MIVVFDSGVWISAIRFRGVPLEAISHALHRHKILTCQEIETEVVRIMQEKFGVKPEQTRDYLGGILEEAQRVVIHGTITGVCRDPKDDFLLECAVTGHADLIVTGDNDLLTLKTFSKVGIISPRQYLDEFARLR